MVSIGFIDLLVTTCLLNLYKGCANETLYNSQENNNGVEMETV